MWHEARRQEKKIRDLMVDYRKRAERRQEFYQRVRTDPSTALRVYGRRAKIFTDPAVAEAAESPQAMTGDERPSEEDRMCNYERYRVLVQNDCLDVSERSCLKQIQIDELFGNDAQAAARSAATEKQKEKLSKSKAAIGFTYDDSASAGGAEEEGASTNTASSSKTDASASERPSDIVSAIMSGIGKPALAPHLPAPNPAGGTAASRKGKQIWAEEMSRNLEKDEIHLQDLDMVVKLGELTSEHKTILNQTAGEYGMRKGDFVKMMQVDKDEEDERKAQRAEIEEKMLYSGKENRRERRLYKDIKARERGWSPPAYMKKDSPPPGETRHRLLSSSSDGSLSSDASRSPSPAGKAVEFITSFGVESSDEEPSRKSRRHSKKRRKRSSAARVSAPSLPPSFDPSVPPPFPPIPLPPGEPSSSSSTANGLMRNGATDRRERSPDRSSRSRSRSPRWGDRRSRGRDSSSRRSRSHSRSLSGHRSRHRQRRASPTRGRYSCSSSSSSLSSSASPPPPRKRSRYRAASRSPERSSYRKKYRRPELEKESDDSDSDREKMSTSARLSEKSKALVETISSAVRTQTEQLERELLRKTPSSKSKGKLTPQERLKLRMQAALGQQLRADRKATAEKKNRDEEERKQREDDLYAQSVRLRDYSRRRDEDSPLSVGHLTDSDSSDIDYDSLPQQYRRDAARH